MHEYSIVGALLDQVEGEAQKHERAEVLVVRIRVGELAGVDTGLLETAWSLAREGTCCERARLDVSGEPVRWGCPDCDRTIDPSEALRCPDCERPARLSSGDALMLERIEMEVE